MTQTRKMILNKLNETYEKDSSIENASKLVRFVDNELKEEYFEIHRSKSSLENRAAVLVWMFYSLITVFIVYLLDFFIPKTWATGPIWLALIFVVLITIFEKKNEKRNLYDFFKNKIDPMPAEKRKMLNLYLQAKEQISVFENQNQEQELLGKYLDRNGNPIDVEPFKCENPKDTISGNLGTLCRAVIMQKAILPQQAQSVNGKIAQVEFEKELPIAVIEMIGSCFTFNMHMFGSLYGLIKELNISEDSSDYVYIQQLIDEYEKEMLKESI